MSLTLGLIPARAGSRRLPQKNTRLMAGRPMIAWTVSAAIKSKVFSKIVVSTDSAEIANVAVSAGAEVPFLRPSNLASDEASSVDVALHALDQLGGADILVLLQPTSPLRLPDEIIECVQCVKSGAPAAVTVRSISKPWSVYRRADETGRLVSCLEPPMLPNVILSGSVYSITPSILRAERTFLPEGTISVNVPESRSIDIDYAEEFDLCDALLRRRMGQ